MCFRTFESDKTCQSKDILNERIGLYSSAPEESDLFFALLDYFHDRPINAIANLLISPRLAKATLRRTWQTWQILHGEIDLDDLLVGNVIRTISPEIFTFLNQNIGRIRSLGHEATTDGARERQTRVREKLYKEYGDILGDTQINQAAMTLLVEFLFPNWTKDSFYKPEVHQGVFRAAQPTDYWERLTKESLDSRDISDQYILQAIAEWKDDKRADGESLAHKLLETDGFAEKIEQFGFLFNSNELRELAEQLFSLILSQNRKLAKDEHHKGFIELWRLALDRTAEGHEDWILSQIHLALPISLRFANELYYYWHNTERSMVGIDHPQPELRRGVIAEAKTVYWENPEVFAGAVESSLIYSLYHLVYLYSGPRYGGIGFENEDWHWLADTILKAGEKKPESMIPQLAGLTVHTSGKEDLDSFQFDQGNLQRLFLDKESQAMELLISTEFDESELDKDDKRIVVFARQEAVKWFNQRQTER